MLILRRIYLLSLSLFCSTVIQGTAIQAQAKPVKDNIVIGMVIEPSMLDPTASAPTAIAQVTWQNIFEGLTALNEKGEVIPALAKSWSVSPDGLTYSFQLQSNVTFHNGVKFDANIAKFALNRVRDANSLNPQKRFFENIKSIETVRSDLLVITLSRPISTLLYKLSWAAFVMVEPSTSDNNKTNPVGTGPYSFVSWTKGDRIILQRNSNYWGKKSAIEQAVFRFIANPQSQVAALIAGDVDAFPEFTAPELMSSFENHPHLTTKIGKTPMKMIAGMNNQRKPFDDIRVRQALMMAVDRQAVIDGGFSGFGTPIGSHYTPMQQGYIDTTATLPYNPEKAKQLLAQAGYPNGFSFTMKVPQLSFNIQPAEVVQAMLAEIGVNATIEPLEFPSRWMSEVYTKRDFDMTLIVHAESMDIDIYTRNPYYFNYQNEALNNILKTVETTLGNENNLYQEAQRILAYEVPALYLFGVPKLGVWDKRLHGLWQDQPTPSNVLAGTYWDDLP